MTASSSDSHLVLAQVPLVKGRGIGVDFVLFSE